MFVSIVLLVVFTSAPILSANSIDAEADKILLSMSTFLDGLPAFVVAAEIDSEIVDLQGQKIQLSSTADIAIQRPDKLHIHRQGAYANAELLFDGETLTLHEMDRHIYKRMPITGTTDVAIRTLEDKTGIDAPGADLLLKNVYANLTEGTSTGAYLGTAWVQGIECHHLAFRADQVDWQLWVQTGKTPLPMKYVITTKWVTGAPQYSVRFRNWNLKPILWNERFTFKAPEGAKELEELPVNEVGEIVGGGLHE
jgi:hypothetical protein